MIDNINELHKSGLPIILTKGTALTDYFRGHTDIFKKAIMVNGDPHILHWIITMYVKVKKIVKIQMAHDSIYVKTQRQQFLTS